eukprot:CAMPEP_0181319722 /NCGR_PEP_ID=MMETSP1101-20121128/17730_1 /TAXON_ID=46948 /ORGANISM="Rhodomonas abbreviata, Strain Caron Lab Isolate" /LENGTH=557 /DNA_ID=CAMNT_0023427355 /DNA_START=141 /DNA_END=1814 /DNA_ORIENTATION=-
MAGALHRAAVVVACIVLTAEGFSGPPLSLAPEPQLAAGAFEFTDERMFKPKESMTFEVVDGADPVDLHFLDSTNLKGFTAQDMIQLGPYAVESRLGMITSCNSPICRRVDGILGFGFKPGGHGNSLLTTLIQEERKDWGIKQPHDFRPMPPKFSFTASADAGELQLGGFDPDSVEGGEQGMVHFPMRYLDYGVSVPSIRYGKGENAVELLNFKDTTTKMGYLAKFDSGTSCILMPNTTLDGQLTDSPFNTLLAEQLKGRKESLYYTLRDVDGNDHEVELEYEECVEPTNQWMILGDPWFRKFVVLHDLSDPQHPTMGLGLRRKEYQVGEGIDEDYLEAFAGTTVDVEDDPSREETRTEAVEAAALAGRDQSQLRAVRTGKMTGRVRARREHAHSNGLGSLALLSETLETLAGAVEKVRLATDRIVYTVTVGIGTPPQERNVVFDTGSYMLGVFSAPAPAATDAPAWEAVDSDVDHSAAAVTADEDLTTGGYTAEDAGAPVVLMQRQMRDVSPPWEGLGVHMAVGGSMCLAIVAALFVASRRPVKGARGGERAPLLHV